MISEKRIWRPEPGAAACIRRDRRLPVEPIASSQVSAFQSTLDVIRLPPDQGEPEGEDCVQVARLPSGEHQFSGGINMRAADLVADFAAFISGAVDVDGPFSAAEAAEAAAIEWRLSKEPRRCTFWWRLWSSMSKRRLTRAADAGWGCRSGQV